MIHPSVSADLLTAEQLRQYLGLPEGTYYRHLAQGHLPPSIRLGNRRYWRRQTVERWLADQEAASKD